MNQPLPRMFKRIALALLILLTLSGCRLVSNLSSVPPTSTPTPTPSQTQTPENCFWNWAYGEGSSEFDHAVIQKLADEGIAAAVESSSYGEVYSCDLSFHPKDLDVKVEIKVDKLADQVLLTQTSEIVLSILQDNLAISDVNNLGNVSLTYINPDGNSCFWNATLNQCAE